VQTQSVRAVVTVAPLGNLRTILVTTESFALYQWTKEKPGVMGWYVPPIR
jgi:hypothetical protein